MTTATLEQVVAAADVAPESVIEVIVSQLRSQEDQLTFVRGLSERLVHLQACADQTSAAAATEQLSKWVCTWFVSVRMSRDDDFAKADAEATRMLEHGELGDGMTGSALMARYGRRR